MNNFFGVEAMNIIRILPQKPPAIAIDRILEIDPGVRILTKKNVSISEPGLVGRFPGLPILPETALMEAMIQSCCVLAYATEKYDPNLKISCLIGVNKTKFKKAVRPGDSLEIEAILKQRRSNVWRFDSRIFESDSMVVESELVISYHDRDDIY